MGDVTQLQKISYGSAKHLPRDQVYATAGYDTSAASAIPAVTTATRVATADCPLVAVSYHYRFSLHVCFSAMVM